MNTADLLMFLASSSGAFGKNNKLMQALMARNMAKGSGKENIAMLLGMTAPDRASLMSSLSALGATPQALESNQVMDKIKGQVGEVDTTTTQTIGRILGIETNLDTEFVSVKSNVDQVDTRVADVGDKLGSDVDSVGQAVAEVDRKVTVLAEAVGVVDFKADGLEDALDGLRQQLVDARAEIAALQATVDGVFPVLSEMHGKIDEILRIIPLGTTWSFRHGRL